MGTFADWFKRRRRELGVSQEELAASIGYSVASVRKVEQGRRVPSLQMTRLLATFLDVPEVEYGEFVRLARSRAEPQVSWEGGSHGNSTVTVPNNLPPSPLTQLIGREGAVADLLRMLAESGVRLLTLTGPPGVGKTSLSLKVASCLLDEQDFRDGVFFINLAPTREPRFVAGTIARTLGLNESGEGTSIAALIEHLRGRYMLLVLDNFEQVVDAGPELSLLLANCPGLKALVTSRESLNVRGEHLFHVPPLEVPDAEVALTFFDISTIMECASVQLLVERATSANPDFCLTQENAHAIAQVCARMEGLPLAIELVAARTRLFPIEEIVARVDHKLSLLVGGPRDASPRQQTLRGAIEWSYNLLNSGEQVLFARLAVFAGSCNYPAAEAVCNATGDLPIDVLEGLESLLNKSLLRYEARGGDWRFSMLETIREYALEKLVARGEDEKTAEVHAEYFLSLAEVSEPHLAGTEQKAWLDRLERDHENLRAALGWATEKGRLLLAVRIAGSLGRFWETHGHLHEGRYWLDTVLSMVSEGISLLPPGLVAILLTEAGALAAVQADYARSISLYESALALLEHEKDSRERAKVLYRLARIRNEVGDLEGAQMAASESVALYRALGDSLGTANLLNMLGTITFYGGNKAQGLNYYNQSLALYQEVGDRQGAANVLNNLGEVARLDADYERAALLYRESLEPCRQLGDLIGTAITLNNLGYMALNLGNYDEAKQLFTEALATCRSVGSRRTEALGMYGLAGALGIEGNLEEAARLFGAAKRLSERINTSFAPADLADFEKQMVSVRSQMGEAAWATAWREGYSTFQ